MCTSCFRYCGRPLAGGACGSCPRAHRSDGTFCQPCGVSWEPYDVLYLILNLFVLVSIHRSTLSAMAQAGRRPPNQLIIAMVVEFILAIVVATLVTEPFGSFTMYSCGVEALTDWYPAIFNPSIACSEGSRCVNEVVFPLYTWIFKVEAFSIVFAILIRSILGYARGHFEGNQPVSHHLFMQRGRREESGFTINWLKACQLKSQLISPM